VIGRRPGPEPPATGTADEQLAALRARVDQALTVVRDAQRGHTGDRALVDVCLDVRNALLGPPAAGRDG
jgi:hypothetical protein